MKKLLSATALALAVSVVHAAPVYQPAGMNLTLGEVSDGQSIISDVTNPAASTVPRNGEDSFFRFGLISNIGVGVEFGQIDDVFTLIDEKAKAYSDGLTVTAPPVFSGDPNNPADVNAYIAAVQAAIDAPVADINSVLAAVASDGYGKAFASMNLPLMPIVMGNGIFGGALVFDVSASATSKAVGLADTINVDFASVQAQLLSGTTNLNLGEVSLDLNTKTLKVNNDSTLLTRAAGVGEMAIGYSRKMYKGEAGGLYGGLRAKYYKVGLTRVATRLGDVTDAEQLFQDIRNAEFNYASGFGIDLGAQWVGEHYRLGATATNLNEPSFVFPALDVSLYRPGGAIAARLGQDYTYTMTRQLKLEGALYSASRKWAINAAVDANAAADPLGDEYQWATIGGAYYTDSWWIPGARVGYRSNLAGSALDYVSLGVTLFKILNVDGAMSLNSVTLDGTTVPRGAMLNMGLALAF